MKHFLRFFLWALCVQLYASIPNDPVKDFVAVTQVASTPYVLVVNPSVPAANVREFIAYARAHSGKGVETTHVPYKGAAPAMNDLIGGQIQLMFDSLARVIKASGAKAD